MGPGDQAREMIDSNDLLITNRPRGTKKRMGDVTPRRRTERACRGLL